MMALVWLGSACGCVRWIGMPPLPPGSFNDTALYGVTKNKWGGNVNRARKLMRQPEAGFDWRLAGTAVAAETSTRLRLWRWCSRCKSTAQSLREFGPEKRW